jgi:hypothetical protein
VAEVNCRKNEKKAKKPCNRIEKYERDDQNEIEKSGN